MSRNNTKAMMATMEKKFLSGLASLTGDDLVFGFVISKDY
jgi:hypothetical protein